MIRTLNDKREFLLMFGRQPKPWPFDNYYGLRCKPEMIRGLPSQFLQSSWVMLMEEHQMLWQSLRQGDYFVQSLSFMTVPRPPEIHWVSDADLLVLYQKVSTRVKAVAEYLEQHHVDPDIIFIDSVKWEWEP